MELVKISKSRIQKMSKYPKIEIIIIYNFKDLVKNVKVENSENVLSTRKYRIKWWLNMNKYVMEIVK